MSGGALKQGLSVGRAAACVCVMGREGGGLVSNSPFQGKVSRLVCVCVCVSVCVCEGALSK